MPNKPSDVSNASSGSSASSSLSSSASLGQLLQTLALVLLAVFVISLLTALLPLQLLNPEWQLGVVAALINNANLALVAGLLVPLGYAFDLSNERLRRRRALVRSWALAAAIGFLLLIPVQMLSGWNYYQSVASRFQNQSDRSVKRLAAVRDAISSAPSQEELQKRMIALLGPRAVLSPLQQRLPLPELRQQLIQQTELASTQLQRRLEIQNRFKPDRVLKESLRLIALAITYAIGFGFLAGVLPWERKKRSSIRT